jgi:ABC-type nitrate/sulfonate/bicarbonate transport system substrate-binding protein
MRRVKFFPLLAGLLLILLVCDARAQKINLVGGLSAFSAAFMPAFVADQAGYFAQEGLAVRLVFFQSGVQLMQSIISGDTQIGMGSAPELVTAVNAGAKVRGVWGISNLVDKMTQDGTLKRSLGMTDLIDYRFIHEAQKK